MDLIEKILSRSKTFPPYLPSTPPCAMLSLLPDRRQRRLPEPIRNAIHYHHFGMVGGEPDRIVASVHLGDILARALTLFIQPINIISICASLKEQEFKEIYEQADKIAQIVSGPITYLCIKTTR